MVLKSIDDFRKTEESRHFASAIEQRVTGGQQLMSLANIAKNPSLNAPKL